MFRIICAWCKRDLGEAVGCSADSHGICKECMAKELAKMAAEDRKAEDRKGEVAVGDD